MKFSAPKRSGDGSDPFRRYQYCFKEYQLAIQGLIDDEGNSVTDINIHALCSCLETYLNNI